MSALTIAPCATPLSSRSIAVPPTNENQNREINEGINIAPMMYSRIVLPLETRARNNPTNGANAIHQAQ